MLQVVCDKILKERDEIRRELIDMRAEQKYRVLPKFGMFKGEQCDYFSPSISKRKNLEAFLSLKTQLSGKDP